MGLKAENLVPSDFYFFFLPGPRLCTDDGRETEWVGTGGTRAPRAWDWRQL